MLSWHRTSNATRGAVAATMDHSDIRGLATAFHLFVAGLPRSRVGDHPVDARVELPRIPLIEPARHVAGSMGGVLGWCGVRLLRSWGAGPRSGRCSAAAVRRPRRSRRVRGRWRRIPCSEGRPAPAQASVALSEPQLSAPGDVAQGFGLALLTHHETAADLGSEAIGPGGFDQDASGMAVAGFGDAALVADLNGGVFEGTRPRYAISARGWAKRCRSPISASR